MIFIYLLFCVIPVWLIFRVTSNYSVLIGCRHFLKYSFLFLCVISIISLVIDKTGFDTMGMTAKEIARNKGEAIGFIALIPLIWNIWMSFWGLKFYGASHIENLDYFILYLRSFKDDKKKTSFEHKLMRAMYSFFCPFAVGRPKDINTSSLSAIRLYVGEEWKENVKDMMEKAPVILLRVSDTENFFWEFEQCVFNEYIGKSIFWVSDKRSYLDFYEKVKNKYDLALPSTNSISDNSLIYKEVENFCVFSLNSKTSYAEFIKKYNESRCLTLNHVYYFSGRDKSLVKQFFIWERDPNMMEGVQEWCWTAFFFPCSYMIMQRFPNRGVLYLLSLLLTIGLSPLRIPLMIYMGRNAKKMVWLSEKWESVSYFEDIHQNNNLKVIGFAACLIIYIFSIFI